MKISKLPLPLPRRTTSTSNTAGKPRVMKIGLHTHQQSMILEEMTTFKKKLEDENLELRDELDDAKMTIRLLQLKLDSTEDKRKEEVSSDDATVKAGLKSRFWKVQENMPTRTQRNQRKVSLFKKDMMFRNPFPKGEKSFKVDNKKTQQPPQTSPLPITEIFVPVSRTRNIHPSSNARAKAVRDRRRALRQQSTPFGPKVTSKSRHAAPVVSDTSSSSS